MTQDVFGILILKIMAIQKFSSCFITSYGTLISHFIDLMGARTISTHQFFFFPPQSSKTLLLTPKPDVHNSIHAFRPPAPFLFRPRFEIPPNGLFNEKILRLIIFLGEVLFFGVAFFVVAI